MLYQIYLVVNSKNGKKYVGQVKKSRGYEMRFSEHVACAMSGRKRCYFHNAIRYYGKDCFSVSLIEDNVLESDVDSREQYWIETLKTNNKKFGYNMTSGGQGVHGYSFTDKDLRSISRGVREAWEKLHHDPIRMQERSNKLSNAMRGRVFTDQHRRKLSEKASLRTGDRNPFYGKSHSDSTRNRISVANSLPVAMCDLTTGEVIRKFSSAYNASLFLLEEGKTKNKYASSRILKICHGVDKSAYGYSWKFV